MSFISRWTYVDEFFQFITIKFHCSVFLWITIVNLWQFSSAILYWWKNEAQFMTKINLHFWIHEIMSNWKNIEYASNFETLLSSLISIITRFFRSDFLSCWCTMCHIAKTKKAYEIDLIVHFIFSCACNASNFLSMKVLFFEIILKILTDFEISSLILTRIHFSDKNFIILNTEHHICEIVFVIFVNFVTVLWFSYIVMSFDNIVFFLFPFKISRNVFKFFAKIKSFSQNHRQMTIFWKRQKAIFFAIIAQIPQFKIFKNNVWLFENVLHLHSYNFGIRYVNEEIVFRF